MKIDLRNTFFSTPRYIKYLNATSGDKVLAKRLYNANIRLAQAFHPVLSQFEVVLRNSINNILSTHFNDADWIINQKSGFMNNPTLVNSNYFLKNSILKTESSLNRRSIPITSGKIISDQNFGFWLALFLPHHFSLIGGRSLQIFVHKPHIENRASIYNKLDEIRNFRNRVNHCEPICFSHGLIDCSIAADIRIKVFKLIEWVEPELTPFFESIDNVQVKIDQINRILI